MNSRIYEQARQARDPRFDGRFFIGVKTTGIYCRPVCPVKIPMAKNVLFFKTAAAAAEAGFRPCLRCRPETAPGTPAWIGTSATVKRALRLISQGALDGAGVEALAERLGVSSRHLGRLFSRHLGASPVAIAQTRRLQNAKQLLDETELSMVDIALASGYGSVRRFNDHFKQVYGRAPGVLRKKAVAGPTSKFHFKLAYRPPFDYAGLLNFLALRAIPGVETVVDQSYSRTLKIGDEAGRVSLCNDPVRLCLRVQLELDDSSQLITVLQKVRCLFDLAADPMEISRGLARDKKLWEIARHNPGQRVPGCWDPFEIAVRAIVGQQISVAGASTIMGRIAVRYGEETDRGRCFPTAAALAVLDPDTLSMPATRAGAIRQLSQLVLAGDIDFNDTGSHDELLKRLRGIKGVGPWTASYIGMRALDDPDAFPHNDLVLIKRGRKYLDIDSADQLLARSANWQPWRAYAALHLWQHTGQQ